jgi:aspartate carbamoyltransferase catalytic subunit
VPALRGKTIASVFFEDSTRTRLSFETAAKRLSAEVMTFSASTSSVNKGESLRDTIETLTAMGVHAFVVRHKSSGVPKQITQWTNAAVVNAGDGWHQHPTQAMLDAYTITRNFGDKESMAGRTIAIVGDIKHSRVARSNVDVFTRMGANVVLVAPDALLPSSIEGWNVSTASSIDEVVGHVDVLYMLRMQRERMDESLVISLKEYTDLYALTEERAARLAPHALLMHPGPINRGVEMQVDPSEVPGSRILQQVANGISVRMAVLFSLLGGEISPAATLGGDA